ncbi:MAG: Fe-S cluster assembly protein HesB [Candidatus Thorarchaeota archaeon]|nr:Fe-S cluster assembly protein HesB [Candidatus Thorarchaeota archaeon]
MNSTLSSDVVESFQSEIMDWWSKNARDLPWRRNPTPYNVLVSEIMLQQTQVSRVISKYEEFLREFPDIERLAAAQTKHLLRTWSGLGYNRRALWLREAAQQIVQRGFFPQDEKELRNLKGIGPYTSRSILIFAFNMDLAAVDTNIRRVLISKGFASKDTSEDELQKIANSLLLKGQSSDWHNALMDYGAEVLTSSKTGIAPTSKQPKFTGSVRQIRGEIVRVLTECDTLTLDELISLLKHRGIKHTEILLILEKLISENLVDKDETGRYGIGES